LPTILKKVNKRIFNIGQAAHSLPANGNKLPGNTLLNTLKKLNARHQLRYWLTKINPWLTAVKKNAFHAI
jgi:hypothetical protein